MFTRTLASLLAATTLATASAAAQRRQSGPIPSPAATYSLRGTIADADGTPLDAVELTLVRHDSTIRHVRAGDDGRFRFDGLRSPRFDLVARRLGYLPRTTSVRIEDSKGVETVFVKLDAVSDKLGTVYVDDAAPDTHDPNLREFYRREQQNKLAYFIDENTMAALHPEYASDALRRVPGVVVLPQRMGNLVKIRGCAPLIWIDGMRNPGAQLDDLVSGGSVAAMEIYSSLAGVPPQYMDRSATCGTILVWLKSR